MGDVIERSRKWQPSDNHGLADGRALFSRHCAACHGPNGLGNGPLSLDLVRKPANLVAGPFVWTPPGENLDLRVARVIKFGLPPTDMPGHETLTDSQVSALSDWVLRLRAAK